MPQIALPLNTPLELRLDTAKNKIYSHIRKKWLDRTPEETVRQEYLLTLVNEYGYQLDQIEEEVNTTGRGSAQARADFIIWRSAQERQAQGAPFVIIECKADNVTISEADYMQGELYARQTGALFFVTHNHRETRYWQVLRDKFPGYRREVSALPHAADSDKDIQKLLAKLRTFRETEFADTLHSCHNIIRNSEHLDPAAAFDEIAKILFVKVHVERAMRQQRARRNLFTLEVLDQQISDDPINTLFDQTKKARAHDRLFAPEDRINLRPATSRAIVEKLQVYNLSDTGEDVKGIAFERFLRTTFRQELGQYFTPRPIVEFIVRLLDPRPGEVLLDPAAGSGGFLIRAFEWVREALLREADTAYAAAKTAIEAETGLTEAEQARRLTAAFEASQKNLNDGLKHLANNCLYGTDANERMARTSKMNMIMHGDGHGGVHHHNGLLNVNGIFEDRFDVILTNPPFGAAVEPTSLVTADQINLPDDTRRHYETRYGDAYRAARAALEAATGKPIVSLFDLGTSGEADAGERRRLLKQKTEILFIERCLRLLKPGGRLGVVLPESIFNNPSLDNVRRYCEDRARLMAVVSLPPDTFKASGATVKCSLLFLRKFTAAEATQYAATLAQHTAARTAHHQPAREQAEQQFDDAITEARAQTPPDREAVKIQQAARKTYLAKLAVTITEEARNLTRQELDYPFFLYEAERVGITATGDADLNELYPNDTWDETTHGPTTLGYYQAFAQDADAFTAALEVEADDADDDTATLEAASAE